MAINILITYAQEDGALAEQLQAHLQILQQEHLISLWPANDISMGTVEQQEVDPRLSTADVMLFLVSQYALNSDYFYSSETLRAIERHERGEARVIPILLRPVYYGRTPLALLPALPTGAKPVITWHNLGEAFSDVVEGIRKVVKEFHPNVGSPAYTKEQLVHTGTHFYQAKHYEAALDAFEKALALDSHHTDAWQKKGTTLRALGRYEEALAACNEALRLDPYSTDAYSLKGSVLASLGRYKEALEACDQALRLDPNNGQAHGVAGGALISLERHQEAVRAIERALQLDPGNAGNYFNRGQVFLKFGRFQEAITAYDQALRLDPDFFLAYMCRGRAYLNLGFPKVALTSIEEGLRRDPFSPLAPMAHELRIEILGNLGHR